ncbi:hypothetical protein B7486_78290, partial [cyanobacterium TDX16]
MAAAIARGLRALLLDQGRLVALVVSACLAGSTGLAVALVAEPSSPPGGRAPVATSASAADAGGGGGAPGGEAEPTAPSSASGPDAADAAPDPLPGATVTTAAGAAV